jgi:UDP-perosamine 4-acetyltransferase
MTPLVILGAGGHAQVVAEILALRGEYRVVGFLDAQRELWGSALGDSQVLGGDDLLPQLFAEGVRHAFVGVGSVGDTRIRRELYERVEAAGFSMARAIHPGAVVLPSATIGAGAAIMAAAVVNTGARLGRNVIVNTGAIIEHHCVVGDHAHVATSAALAGNVHIGEGAHVGIGAVIRQGARVGAGAIVGAGAVVIRDVPDRVTVFGVPARRLSPHS